MSNVLHSFTNSDTGMTAFVVESSRGGYNVSLRDDDSGEFASFVTCGIKDINVAIAKAKEVL